MGKPCEEVDADEKNLARGLDALHLQRPVVIELAVLALFGPHVEHHVGEPVLHANALMSRTCAPESRTIVTQCT